MLGHSLIAGMIELELQDAAEFCLRLASPIVTIATEPADDESIGVGESKFGGLPDLSDQVDWPACHAGRLAFLGEIQLGDLKATRIAGMLPASGLISFFAYDNDGNQPGTFPAGEDE